MCDKQTEFHNGLVEDAVIIYRVCPTRDCFNEAKDKIQAKAFYKNAGRDPDGLSLAPSFEEAKNSLDSGHGVVKISAGKIRALGLGLEVRYDTRDKAHIMICNMPCHNDLNERKDSENFAAELAEVAEIESNQKFRKKL